MSDARGVWEEGDDPRRSAMLTVSAFILLDVAVYKQGRCSERQCIMPRWLVSQTGRSAASQSLCTHQRSSSGGSGGGSNAVPHQ